MRAVCSHYTNTKRACLILDQMLKSYDVAMFPIHGIVVRTGKGFQVVGDTLDLVVFCKGDSMPFFITTTPSYKEFDKQVIDIDTEARDSFFYQILQMCRYKFLVSGNPFSIDFTLDGCTLTASAKSDDKDVAYCLHAPAGDGYSTDSLLAEQIKNECRGIKAFSYAVTTNEVEKTISIKRGQIEIFKEISHYVNRGMLMTTLTPKGIVREVCLTSNGCCEHIENKDGQESMTKIPFMKVSIDTRSSISWIDLSIDSLLRAKSFSDAIRWRMM